MTHVGGEGFFATNFFLNKSSDVDRHMKNSFKLRHWMLQCCGLLIVGAFVSGCDDGGGPVADDDEIAAYLTENPEMVTDLDSENAVVEKESVQRVTVAAP